MSKLKCQTKSKVQISKLLDFGLCHSFGIWVLSFEISLGGGTREDFYRYCESQ